LNYSPDSLDCKVVCEETGSPLCLHNIHWLRDYCHTNTY